MPQLTRKGAILAKIEGVYGTDSVPAAVNAILVRNLDVTPLDADMVSRDLVRPYLGASENLVASYHVKVAFEVEMAGSGAAGTAPAYGPLLRACGLAETIVAATSATYVPVSDNFQSVTLYYNNDGIRHKVLGSRGNVEIDMTSGRIPVLKFNFLGLYVPPTDTAVPVVDYSAFQTPLPLNTVNTPDVSFFGIVPALSSLRLNLNNGIQFRNLVGLQEVLQNDRKVSGTIVIQSVPLATKNFFAEALGTALGTLDITHGLAAGGRVQVLSTRVDIGNPSYQDMDGVQMLQIPVTLVPSSVGNNELSIIVR
jgi:hypothetical protein